MTPYRDGSAVATLTAPVSVCPFCSNEVPPLVRLCPHCDVRFDNVRCTRCFYLQGPGAFACGRCGQALELEPLLDAIDAPCPRCKKPLEAAGGGASDLCECPRCGGLFVSKDTLAEILSRAELAGSMRDPAVPGNARLLDEIRYLPCPLCHASMNRVNFGKVSGVIVDVCGTHGTWFDAGELTRVVVFASSGGLEKTRLREREEKQAIQTTAAAVHADLVAFDAADRSRSRVELWRDLLRGLFDW